MNHVRYGMMWLTLLGLAAVVGCVAPEDTPESPAALPEDPAEAVAVLRTELATKTARIESLEADLQRSTEEIRLLRQQVDSLQADLDRLQKRANPDNEFNVENVTFGMLTGGADWDDTRPGDDGLLAYVYPVDSHGDTLKRAGSFDFTVFDLMAEDDHVLTRRQFDVKSNQQHWRSFPTAGYQFRIPVRLAPPYPRKLVLKVTFTDLSGRVFKATHEVNYRGPGEKDD